MALEELREFFAQLFQFEHKLQNWLMAENKDCEEEYIIQKRCNSDQIKLQTTEWNLKTEWAEKLAELQTKYLEEK